MRTRLCPPAVCLLALFLLLVVPIQAAVTDIRLSVYASGFTQPIAFVQDPADPQVQFVAEQGGRIRVLVNGQVQSTDFLNLGAFDWILSGGEQGLLGLAFPPDAAASGRFFVNFTNKDGHTVVARFTRSSPRVANPNSRLDLLWSTGERFIRQPYANHNGGCLQFGPDGYLYIAMGDGGSGDDPKINAQNPVSLLGKMLRIDVSVLNSNQKGFQIPPDNPWVPSSQTGVSEEIWSFGLRNPWRFSFDEVNLGGTGAMIIGDVGQGQWEEVDYEPRGAGGRNYGWRNREGAHDHFASPAPAFLPLRDPIHEYDHSVGNSITGGYVYRGGMAELRGRYFFADYVKARIWSMLITPHPTTHEGLKSDLVEHTGTIGQSTGIGNISSFGVDYAGELYVVDHSRGLILRVGVPPRPATNLRVVQ